MELEEICARLEIQQVIATYCRGVDRSDEELLRSIYHPDAVDDHALFVGKGMEFAPWVINNIAQSDWSDTQHHVTNIFIEYHGDWAGVESYYLAFHPTKNEEQEKMKLEMGGGRYIDRFEKRNGKWKIALRRVTMDWAVSAEDVDVWQAIHAFPAIGGKNVDPSYGILSGAVKD